MFGRWERVQVSIKTKLRKCPECKALIEDIPGDQTAHMEAHFPPEEDNVYQYAEGVIVERPRRVRDELRDIFRLRPVREAQPVDDSYERKAVAFRAAMAKQIEQNRE